MDEDGAAALGDPRPDVVVELDNEVVKVVRPPQAVARLSVAKPNGTVVAGVGRVFAPGVRGVDAADRQKGARSQAPVGPPPHPHRMEPPPRGRAVALALVRPD